MELIRTPQAELADLIERTLKRNGFQVDRHEDEGQFVLGVPDAEQYPHARQLTAELIADLKRGQSQQAVEPLTGQPQPLLSGGWLASMGWVTERCQSAETGEQHAARVPFVRHATTPL